jgi:hypothetical protein
MYRIFLLISTSKEKVLGITESLLVKETETGHQFQ